MYHVTYFPDETDGNRKIILKMYIHYLKLELNGSKHWRSFVF